MKQKRYSPTQIKVKEVNKDLYQIRFILSTPSVDRHGEIIDQKGWKLENYIKNPVVLWAHDQSIPAIGKMVDIGIVNGNLEGTVQFAYKENADAAKIFDLVAGEYINAGSVGFMNDKWMYDEQNDLLTLLENELYEFSIVNVGANAEALQKAKAKGLDIEVVNRLNTEHEKNGRDADPRFKNLGAEVKSEEAPAEEKPEDKKDEEKADEGEPEKPEEKKDDEAGATGEPTDDEVKSAIETLCKANATKIKEAMDQLKGKLQDADKKEVDTTPVQGRGEKRYTTHSINRAIRVLLAETRE